MGDREKGQWSMRMPIPHRGRVVNTIPASADDGPGNNSWGDIRIPSYLICGELENPQWRRQPFDRYPAIGDKFLTIGKGYGHNIVNGDLPVKRLLSLNTALFFHTYLRNGGGRDQIGTLAWIDGWALERKLDPGTDTDRAYGSSSGP